MSLNQLVYFCTVAKTGSYSRAAEELGVSEPVVYRAIKRLEKACGMSLVHRAGNRVCLTKSGRSIYEHAIQMASLADSMQQRILEERKALSGSISIGAGIAVGSYLLPEIMAKWVSEHPQVSISVIIGHGQEIHKLLFEDRLDLLLTSVAEPVHGLRRQFIFGDTLVVVSAAAPAKSEFLSIADVSKEPIILPSGGTTIRKEIEEVETQYGVRFKVAMEANDQDTIKRFCAAGIGLAILNKSVVADEVASNRLRLLNVEGFPRNRAYFVAYRSDKTLTPEMQSLLSAIRQWVPAKEAPS